MAGMNLPFQPGALITGACGCSGTEQAFFCQLLTREKVHSVAGDLNDTLVTWFKDQLINLPVAESGPNDLNQVKGTLSDVKVLLLTSYQVI